MVQGRNNVDLATGSISQDLFDISGAEAGPVNLIQDTRQCIYMVVLKERHQQWATGPESNGRKWCGSESHHFSLCFTSLVCPWVYACGKYHDGNMASWWSEMFWIMFYLETLDPVALARVKVTCKPEGGNDLPLTPCCQTT